MSANLEVGKHSHNCCHGDGVRTDEAIARYERMTEMTKAEYEKWKSKALSLEDLSSSTPYITMDGSYVVFNYFTPKQMAEVYMWLEGGNLSFELTKDEEGQYSLTTKSDIQELDGMFIVGGEEFIVNTIVDSFIVDLKGHKVSEVRIEGIDADLLNADFTWKLAEIDNKISGVAKEATSQEILEEVSGIKGDNPDATNSAIYDAINAISPDLVQGKERLATAITSKGVETTSADSLSQMAENVSSITQESYTIDGGEMYAKQLFGSLETPNYWNLYEVLLNLLSDGRLSNYGGILLAEYYREYDSIALEGAGSGGAYVVSDMENGQFKMYTEDTTHVWSKEFDGKSNRWVAYCFADEYHNFQITDTNTSPRSIFIGRNVGVIKAMTNTRLSKIVVPDGNKLNGFDANGYSQEWDKQIVFRNLWNSTTPILNGNAATIEMLYISGNSLSAPIKGALNTDYSKLACLIIEAASLDILISPAANVKLGSLKTIIVKHEEGNFSIMSHTNQSLTALKEICFADIESANIGYSRASAVQMELVFNYKNNDKTKSISLTHSGSDRLNGWAAVNNVILKEGWCKPIDISKCSALTEANMYAHILQRLKQDEPDCGDGVTITLGSTNLAKLTSAESIALLDELTNIYGYTFA